MMINGAFGSSFYIYIYICKQFSSLLRLQIDEYFMMSHHQGNVKLEYNGVFRAQLCMITGSRSVK